MPTRCEPGWRRSPPTRTTLRCSRSSWSERSTRSTASRSEAPRLGVDRRLRAAAARRAAQPLGAVDGHSAEAHRRAAVRRHPPDRTGGAARAGSARRVDAYGVVPAARRVGCGVRGGRPPARRADRVDDRATCTTSTSTACGRSWSSSARFAAGASLRRGYRISAGPGPRQSAGGPRRGAAAT